MNSQRELPKKGSIAMSHGLDKVGSGMFSARNIIPWHNHESCRVVDKVETVEEGIKLAALDWSAIMSRNYVRQEETVDNNGLTQVIEKFSPTDSFSVIRSDSRAVLTEGRAVSESFVPLQNIDAFKWFQPFLDTKEVEFETAGCLHGGSVVWIMARLKGRNSEITANDEVVKYLLLSNSHDGKHAVRVGFSPVRVVCANTLAMAHQDRNSMLIRVRHSQGVQANLNNIRETINATDASFEATADQYRLLATKNINQKDLEKYIKEVFNMKPTAKSGKELATRTSNTLRNIVAKYTNDVLTLTQFDESVRQNFEGGKGNTETPVRGTWWAAYNAVTEYLTHEQGRNWDNRLSSLWFGPNAQVNEHALDVALRAANGEEWYTLANMAV